jgi:hypothetical protein
MSIPNFNDDGLLPSGRHQCTLDEAKDMFAHNDARSIIWDNFCAVLLEMAAAGLEGTLFLDGSYVTDKAIPGDIEVAFDVRNESDQKQGLALLFFHTQHNRLKSTIKVDWYPVLPGNNDFVSFFEYIGDKTAAQKKLHAKELKGILKVTSWP